MRGTPKTNEKKTRLLLVDHQYVFLQLYCDTSFVILFTSSYRKKAILIFKLYLSLSGLLVILLYRDRSINVAPLRNFESV